MVQIKKNIRISTLRSDTSSDIDGQILADGTFNHCSTICPFGNDALIAFYAGSKECAPDQHVILSYNKRILRLPKNTGNPVLVPIDRSDAVLIYSVFTKFDVHPVHKWRYCELYKVRVKLDDGDLKIGTPRKLIPDIGFLGRCPPWIVGNGIMFLPLYHEYPGYARIMRSEDGWNWTKQSEIKSESFDLIQPTMWGDATTMHVLMRNLSGKPPHAFYSTWPDNGKAKWSDPIPTTFHNLSNSIVVVAGNEPLVIWNSSPESRKFLLMKHLYKDMLEPPIILTDVYGSYPSYTKIGTDLHITFTTKVRGRYVICRKIF